MRSIFVTVILASVIGTFVQKAPAERGKIPAQTIETASQENFRLGESSILNIDGRKLMLASAIFGKEGHDDSPAEIYARLSDDGGRTWRKRFLFQPNIGKANVLSNSFLRISDREIMFFFTATNSQINDSSIYYRRSLDNGQNWAEPVVIPPLHGKGQIDCVTDHAVLLKSGRIILPCYYYVRHEVTHSAEKLGIRYTFPTYSGYAICLYSDDRGKTWKSSNSFTVEARSHGRDIFVAAEEPAVIELKDGRLMMFVRNYTGWYYKSYSGDQGASWSKPANAGIPAPGATPQLVRIPTTRDILLLYNYGDRSQITGPHPRKELAAAVSTDEGKNFTSLRIFAGAEAYPGKVMMPNIEFLGDSALIVYCDSPSMKNHYSLKQVIVPIQWFYGGDREQIYGEEFLKKFEKD